MKAVLTGATGFVAARLTAMLAERGWESDSREMAGADCIVHFAGSRTAALEPDILLDDLGALDSALEAAARHRARFVLVSNEAVSGTPRPTPLDEESASILEAGSGELDSAAAGLVAEHLCFACRAAFGMHGTVLRLFGAYGPGQPLMGPDSGIGDWIAAALHGLPMAAAEDEGAPCCLSHADDLARGMCRVLEHGGADGEIVHLADARSLHAGAVARRIWRLAGNAGEPTFSADGSWGRKRFRAPVDSSKAQRLFGFAATVDHDTGLAETIRWHARRSAQP